MADVKISEMPTKAVPADGDFVPILDPAETDPDDRNKKTSVAAIAAKASASGEVDTDATLTGKGTSTDVLKVANPFTAGDETKLDGIEAGAQVNPNAQQIADAISNDHGGDIDFSRVGTGASADLRGLLRNGVVDDAALADEVKDQLLPTFPAAGQRDNKIPKFNGDTLGWEPDAGGGGGTFDGVTTDDTLTGTGIGTDPLKVANPFTTADETKLDGIGTGANKNVQADMGEVNTSSDAYVKNKPPALPALPAEGSRDNKIAKFDGDTLGWETDSGGGSDTPGPRGQRGSTWEVQSGTPPAIQTGDLLGDQSLDSETGDVYSIVDQSGDLAWLKTANIKGPTGNPGPPGKSSGGGAGTLEHLATLTTANTSDTVNAGPMFKGEVFTLVFVEAITIPPDGREHTQRNVQIPTGEVQIIGGSSVIGQTRDAGTTTTVYTAEYAALKNLDNAEFILTPIGPGFSSYQLDVSIIRPAELPEVTAGDGITVSDNDRVAVKPPPFVGGFWGNAQEGEPDVEVLRRRDLIVEDKRNTLGVDITWSNGWTIRGLHVPVNGIGMLNDQSETLSPAPGSSIQGNVPVGEGAWQFVGGSSGHLVWNGKWPSGGMDLKIAVDMSDFQAGDRIHMTLDTNNNNLWGSARTPDRGVDFHGAGDSLHHTHTHIYELRPAAMTDGTTIEIHLEAIKEGNPSSSVPVGLFRAGYVTLSYPPTDPSVPHQVFSLGKPVANTSIDAIGSDAWLIPVTFSTDNTQNNHLEVDSGDSVWEFTRDLRNVLMELLSHSDTTQAAWTFEVWTYVEGAIDWHRVRSYQMPGPTSNTSAQRPAVHIYFDSNAVLDGQQFVLVGRGLTGTPTAASIGNMTIDLDTNPDTRFPETAVLAHGLITSEQITGPENSRNSGQRTWSKPESAVNRWETVYVLVKDGNGAQHSASFDVSSWRYLDESAQMNCEVRSQAQLGADQTLSRNADGKLTYSSGNASVQVLRAYVDIER
ncbi:MAG: hypothetical protein OXG44_10670 [Gammaproteobacteria bacterium]|nr:hypothetical protein [Gammaproteobacteria bacterium]